MKFENYDRQLKTLQEHGLTFQAAIDILEIVAAGTNMNKVPQATLDAVQAIADMFNVSFVYYQTISKTGRGKMALTGIFSELRSSFLYHDSHKMSRFCNQKNAVEYYLYTGADNNLVRADSI